MDAPAIPDWLADLPHRLADAIGADELAGATRPPDGTSAGHRLTPSMIWVGLDRLDAAVPGAMLSFDPPVDARALCAAWGVERPIAISGDTHQAMWSIFVAGRDLPGMPRPVVAADPIRAGRWVLRPWLTGRPDGPLPGLTAGASPAYDVVERGGAVRTIEVDLAPARTGRMRGDHADARALFDAMARAYPQWSAGWGVAPDADVVVAYEGERAIAGAVLRDAGWGVFEASRVSVLPEAGDAAPGAGSALLDALEAVVLHRGGWRLRLDGSVFLHRESVRFARHGYVVAPPYAGDADVPVWAQRDLRDRWTPPTTPKR